MNGDDMISEMHRHMQRQMQQIGLMGWPMNPFGMNPLGMPGSTMPMIGYGHNQRVPCPMPRDPFLGIMNSMGNFSDFGMNDPNSQVFAHSTSITFDGTGAGPRIVEQTVRKSGDAKEERHSVRMGKGGAGDKMRIEHSIGDRRHIIEKRRGRSGHIKSKQQFVNLDEEHAQVFDREFISHVRGESSKQPELMPAITGGDREERSQIGSHFTDSAPIITLPDDESEDEGRYTGATRHGLIIEEITDDGTARKKRKGKLGRLFKGNDFGANFQ